MVLPSNFKVWRASEITYLPRWNISITLQIEIILIKDCFDSKLETLFNCVTFAELDIFVKWQRQVPVTCSDEIVGSFAQIACQQQNTIENTTLYVVYINTQKPNSGICVFRWVGKTVGNSNFRIVLTEEALENTLWTWLKKDEESNRLHEASSSRDQYYWSNKTTSILTIR